MSIISQELCIDNVDFGSPEAVEAYGHLLFSAFNNVGGFAAASPVYDACGIRDDAERWIRKVERNIEAQNARGIQRYLGWYDIVHRMTFGRPASTEFIDKYMNGALMAMLGGDEAERLVFMRWMLGKIRIDPRAVDRKALEWYTAVEDEWINDARSYNPLSNHPLHEAVGIVNFLDGEDLYAWISDQSGFKSNLYRYFMPLLGAVDGICDRRLLEALRAFASIAFMAFPDEADDDTDMKILRRLSALPTIHRYDSRAYALDLETEMNRPDLR